MSKLKSGVNIVMLGALFCAGVAAAAPQGMRGYRALAISSAGDRLAAIESVEQGDSATRPHGVINVRDAASGKVVATFDPCASCTYDFPSWSPDRNALSFIGSDRKVGTATLYVAADGKVAALTTVKGVASTARWSPDGARLALLATVGAKKMTGATEAGAALVGEIGAEEDEQRIAVVGRNGGDIKLVSPADTFIYEYDWTPDGKGFVVTSAKGDGDNNWWVATLGHVDAATGALRILAAPKMQMNMPRMSKDGQTVAFIGGLMSDFGSVGGDVFTVPAAGGVPVSATPGYQGSFNGLSWQGRQIVASALAGSDQAIVAIDPSARTQRTLWSAPVSASGSRDGRFVFSADGAIAASVQEDFQHPARIVAGRLPNLARITHDNEGHAPQVSARSISWTSDHFNVQGWLVQPLKIEAGKKYPMIVMVHGGPAAAAGPRFVSQGEGGNALLRELTGKGYFVFMPNPRGSFGQGTAFSGANKRDFGGGDWRDILAGVDAVEKVAPVDGQRLGLMGHSYGGFMTMWGVTHSQRFKAAVAGAGIANWISYYGQNGIDQWMIPFFGASAYDDPAIYRAASPIESIKSAKTPTMIYVGERDVECPPAQSAEFWHGLKAMGVPTSLVIYDGEGHSIRKPEHQRDQRARTLAWFDRYLKQ
ncbi:S9 family peptidase [Massilia sp. R2A-15]|uniref:S9 family peptidase n=1 Tax=Massilia sp. R2A-15 TaxID=3064278 RepID=UPI002735B4AB|nr:S9 family peptidase [Massilia sp. R2A-15]WLI90382.1 S9 family peptidase [Massilia sp. R2A-15]